jgi:hypothetical protein
MQDSSNTNTPNTNNLLEYVEQNISNLDSEKFMELLNNAQSNLDNQNQNGNTALYLLFDCGGTFKYAQELLKKGANIAIINNNGKTVFDIIESKEKSQPHLRFLSFAGAANQNLSTQIPTPEIALFQESPNSKNQYQKIFKTLSENYFDFSVLKWGEIRALYQLKETSLQIAQDGSESPKSKERQQQFYTDLGFDNQNIAQIFQEFLDSFGGMIELEHDRYIQEEIELQRQEDAIKKLQEKEVGTTKLPPHPLQMAIRAMLISDGKDIKKDAIELPTDLLEKIESYLVESADLIQTRLSLREAIPSARAADPQGQKVLPSCKTK